MKKGYLSQYFTGVAAKQLSAVEADPANSNQHEFNGVELLRKLLGESNEKTRYIAKFIHLTDHDDDPIVEEGYLTWYDARQKARIERGIMRYEYRLYFPSNTVMQRASAGDLLVIAKQPDNTLLAIIAEKDTTISRQISWLFGFSNVSHPGFSVREELDTEQDRIEFASRFILESIGVVVETEEQSFLDQMLDKFGRIFPSTRIFSEFARSTLKDIGASDNGDIALMSWMEREEILFRTLEKHLIGDQLTKGFSGDVDRFISYSLSVQNRRKSRVGLALENHLECLFLQKGVRYKRAAITENRSKPDFIFPGQTEYQDPTFNSLNLTMLGVKSTCKDRWRQVLAEADRIEQKHLLTMEAAISTNQTDEMQSKKLRLVLPGRLHETYSVEQQKWLMNIEEFTVLVKSRQGYSGQ
jgi:hypothetical protein